MNGGDSFKKKIKYKQFSIIFLDCVMFKSCDTCLNTQEKFDCRWCPAIKR
jgi:hypothetical protein